MLTSEETECIYDSPTAEYRYVPTESFDPTPTAIYADRVMNLIWDPLTVVLMRNKGLANTYRKHFEQLWKIAKRKPKGKVRKIKPI